MPIRLLCLTAHPDDEAGGFGGALLRAAEAGLETSVVCLTEGEAGSYRHPGQSDRELAAMRRKEFADACEALGVREHRLLQYPDGGLWMQPFQELVGVLAGAIRSLRPHVVLTFGGEGGPNLHRDHVVVSMAATAAFHWAGRSSFFPEQLSATPVWAAQKLYYAATPFFSINDEEALRGAARTPPTVCFPLGPLFERKWAAFRRHTSQSGLFDRVQEKFGAALGSEDFLLAAARRPMAHESELWDGVDEDPAS